MNNIIKGFVAIVVVVIFSVSAGITSVKASEYREYNMEGSYEKIFDELSVLSEEEVLTLKQNGLISNTDATTSVFKTSYAPDDIVSRIKDRSSDYIVHHYSLTKTFQKTNFWGNKVNFITIVCSGDSYEYTDGKVHLLSMSVQATMHESGWSLEVEHPTIINTDGSISGGFGYVYCTKADTTYGFGCSVGLTSAHPIPDVSITQFL